MLTHRARSVVVALAVASASPVAAQSAAIRLSVSFEKKAYYPGEPVIAHVLLTNTLPEPISIPEALDPEYMRIAFFVTRRSEPEIEFKPWALMENQRSAVLAGNATRAVPSRIFFGADGWTFSVPGAYQVRAVFGRAASEPATLTVEIPPDGPERTQSAALTDSREAGFFLLFDGGDHLANGSQMLRRIAATRTRFSAFANYALGASMAKRFANLQTGGVRAPDALAADVFLRQGEELMPTDAVYYQVLTKQRRIDVNILRGRQPEVRRLRQDLNNLVRQQILPGAFAAPVKSFAETAIRR